MKIIAKNLVKVYGDRSVVNDISVGGPHHYINKGLNRKTLSKIYAFLIVNILISSLYKLLITCSFLFFE